MHRRVRLGPDEVTSHERIPVTTPVRTLIDLATCSSPRMLEAAVNDADKRDLVDPEALRSALDDHAGEAGVRILRDLLDRRTFSLTDSELERRFLPLARRAGLATPLTRQWVNGFRVDFHWPDLGMVVVTDGLRYHRTAAQRRRTSGETKCIRRRPDAAALLARPGRLRARACRGHVAERRRPAGRQRG